MAGRKGKRRNQLTNINPALVPSVAFTVVPRTPAPQHVPTSGLGGSNEVLNSSLLGRPAIPDPGQDDDPFSDPESSLYDYQVMEDAGYSSVEMLSVSRKRRSMGGASTSAREHDIDEHQQASMAPALSATDIHNNPEVLYSKPIKRGQPEKAVPSTSMRTTIEVRDAMRQVQDLSSEDEGPRPQRGHQQPEKRMSARSMHFPVEHETAVKDTVTRSPSSTPKHTPKHKASSREEQIQQEIIEPVQLAQHQTASNEPDDELVSARSRPHSARSVSILSSGNHTARSLTGGQSARSVMMADDKVRSLEAEKDHLTTLTHQLESEVQTYREVVSTYESGDSGTAQSLLTKKQVNDLKEENESLKNSIRRLNVELSAYQAKYRPIKAEEMGNVMGLPSAGPLPSWLRGGHDPLEGHPVIRELNIRYLNPLFLAYDDRIREREETINKCQSELETLRLRTQDIVRENEKLHGRLEQAGSGPIDNTEWAQMKENAKLVLEENQNLLEQINVKDQKAQDLHQAHVREVSKLSKQLVLVKAENSEVEQEVNELRQSHRDLKQKHDNLVLESQGHITQEQHIKEISDMKQKMVDAEEAQKQELDSVNNRLVASQIERKTLGTQVVELSSENKRYQAEVKIMHKCVRKAQQKMMLLQRAIEQSENKEMSVQEYMSSVIKVAEKNAFERDTFEKVAKEHEIETKRAMKKLLHGNITVGKMEEKLKLYKMKAAARIGTVAERLKEQEELFNSQKKEYEREINHLRMLVREKEDVLQETFTEKRDLEDGLEAMWQAANSENVRIKEDMHKSVQKLRKHPALSEAIDAHNRLEDAYISEDETGGGEEVS